MSVLVDARCTIGEGLGYRLDAAGLVAQLDRHGVDVAVVAAADRYLAVANREGNELVLEACAAHPGRLIGLAAANPWYGAAAAAELRRAVAAGMRGLALHPPRQGFMLLDGVVDELLAAAAELGVPVYVHTGTPVAALPLQVTALARRFPELPFVMGHMGHSDFWIDAVPAALGADNVWVELSYKAPHTIEQAVRELGPERVLFGSDAPLNDLGLELAKLAATDLDAHARRLVAGESALALYGGVPA